MAMWSSKIPEACQMCEGKLSTSFVDAATPYGWGLLCPGCHRRFGFGLGVGKGQEYNKSIDKDGKEVWVSLPADTD